jgi:hypothetical protein
MNKQRVLSDWTIFAAATVLSNTTLDGMINSIYNRFVSVDSVDFLGQIFPATYSTDDGKAANGQGSPVLGALFALLSPRYDGSSSLQNQALKAL